MDEKTRKTMFELYLKDPDFKALLWEIHRLERKNAERVSS